MPDDQICPICKKPSTMEIKWTRKKSGKKYNYEVFHHEDTAHWVRVDVGPSGRRGKNETQRKLIEFLDSTRFRQAIFTSNDIVAEFKKNLFHVNYQQVRDSLMKLADSGVLSIVRKDKKVFFINSSNEERLNYIMKKVSIILEDISEEGTFERHYFKTRILNDNELPLPYVQFKATGDNARDHSRLSFSSFDVTRKEKAIIYFLEDGPQKKRILIELDKPIHPGEERTLSIEYFWPEIGPSYTFTASTSLQFFQFSLISRNDFDLSVVRTNAGRTEVVDESCKVISTTQKRRSKVKLFNTNDLPAFAVLKFKWRRQ